MIFLYKFFSFSTNAQYAVMYAVDLNEGAEEDYLSLEKLEGSKNWFKGHGSKINYFARIAIKLNSITSICDL